MSEKGSILDPLKKLFKRFSSFGAIGLGLTIFGALFIEGAVLVGMAAETANLIQAIISIVLNFYLNRQITWKDRREHSLKVQIGRYALGKAISISINQWIFTVVLSFSTPFIAYMVSTVVIMVYNFFLGDRIVFPKKKPLIAPVIKAILNFHHLLQQRDFTPDVSVVVPLRNSGKHINTLLASLFAQDYSSYEIILVGSPGDTTWGFIEPQYANDPRLVILEAEISRNHVGRDSNIKRNWGARHARGSVLAFTDAKITHRTDWISQGIYLMLENKVEAVAGVMVSTEEDKFSFMAMFADLALVRRNPSFGKGYLLTAKNFARGESLPITACWMMTVKAYELMGGFDETFTISYEDYSGAWRYVRAGGTFFCTSEWQVFHKHRTEFRQMMLEFARSARGAAQLYYVYPECPFAKKRLRQAFTTLAVAVTVVTLLLFLAVTQYFLLLGLLILTGLSGFIALGILNAAKAGHWKAFFFPPLTAFFILVFSWNFAHQLFTKGNGMKYLQTAWSLIIRSLVIRTH